MDGGAGNDVLLSRSDAGEMVAAQDGKTQIFAQKPLRSRLSTIR
jgi:hypothetical protein